MLVALVAVAVGVRSAGVTPAEEEESISNPPIHAGASPVSAVVPPADPCPIDWRAGPERVKDLIVCEARVWNVPGGAAQALAVAHCESRFQPAAFNPTGCGGSGCTGLFQQSLRYWRARAIEYGYAGRSPADAKANVVVSMRLASEQGTWAKDWPVCGT
jgi:hypothetical protein